MAFNRRRRTGRRGLSAAPKLVLRLGAGVVVAFLGLSAFRAAQAPSLTISTDREGIGRRTEVTVSARTEGRGLSGLEVSLIQGPATHRLAERSYEARPGWDFWGEATVEDEISVVVGSETIEGLEPGEATIRVTAPRAGAWLWRPAPTIAEKQLEVRLTPPQLTVVATSDYVTQGGSGLVVYRVGPSSVRDGVRVGRWWFPSQPLPESGAEDRFVLFGVPHDVDDGGQILLTAEDELGNQATVAFAKRFHPRPLERETIRVSEGFMSKVVPEIVENTPEFADRGSLLENYLAINGELRLDNATRLERLAQTSSPRFLWDQPFLTLPGSKRMSSFALARTYVHQGQEVDHQVHLGFDLASTRQAPVPAANSGSVVLAEYFGIYGNTVVIDHGCGLMTLYAHLSSIAVASGGAVQRGETIGNTGATGLAGGDHLHFGVLIRGLPVNPLEWWDARWIRGRIVAKLGAALPQ